MSPSVLLRSGVLLAAFSFSSASLFAEGPFRNRDNPDLHDEAEGTYPIPYQLPKPEEIKAVLERIHANLDRAMPTQVVNRKTGEPIKDLTVFNADAIASQGERDGFHVLTYATGVTHAGMLAAAEATGDSRYREFVRRHLQFIGDTIPYFTAQAAKIGVENSSYRRLLAPASLDDSGSMCAAMIKARQAGIGPDLMPVIQRWADYIRFKEIRLADGTIARHRPQPESLWADDAYMCIPALAQMGKLTGDPAWYDEAAKQAVQLARYLFNPEIGLYMHGRHMDQPNVAEFRWGRANGWVILAQCELLDVLPENHPARAEILDTYRRHVKA